MAYGLLNGDVIKGIQDVNRYLRFLILNTLCRKIDKNQKIRIQNINKIHLQYLEKSNFYNLGNAFTDCISKTFGEASS